MRRKIQKYLSGEREGFSLIELIIVMVLCQDLVQVKMRNFSHFNLPKAQP